MPRDGSSMRENGMRHPNTVITMVRGFFNLNFHPRMAFNVVKIPPFLSAHGEISADSEDSLDHEDAAHVDIEGESKNFTPNSVFIEKSAKLCNIFFFA